MHNCEVHTKKAKNGSSETVTVVALGGVFGCKFLADGGIKVTSPQIDNCII